MMIIVLSESNQITFFAYLSSIEPILEVYLFFDDIKISSLYLYKSSPTAVEYLVFPLRSSSPFIDFGDPILDGF